MPDEIDKIIKEGESLGIMHTEDIPEVELKAKVKTAATFQLGEIQILSKCKKEKLAKSTKHRLVLPITSFNDVGRVKEELLCRKKYPEAYFILFTIGTSTALKPKRLMELKYDDVTPIFVEQDIQEDDYLLKVDGYTIELTEFEFALIANHIELHLGEFIYPPAEKVKGIRVSAEDSNKAIVREKTFTDVIALVCKKVNVHKLVTEGTFSGESLRKTYGYLLYTYDTKQNLSYLTKVFGHSNTVQLANYLCVPEVERTRKKPEIILDTPILKKRVK